MFHSESRLKKLEWILRLSVPQVFLMFLLLLNVLSLPLPYIELLRPNFVLMGLYYWAIYRPTLIPSAFCFVLGLLMDFVTGSPPGLNALIYVFSRFIVTDQRRFFMGQPYLVTWIGFAVLSIMVTLGQWGLMGLSIFDWVNPLVLIPNALVTICLFPFMTLLLILIHRVIPVEIKRYS